MAGLKQRLGAKATTRSTRELSALSTLKTLCAWPFRVDRIFARAKTLSTPNKQIIRGQRFNFFKRIIVRVLLSWSLATMSCFGACLDA